MPRGINLSSSKYLVHGDMRECNPAVQARLAALSSAHVSSTVIAGEQVIMATRWRGSFIALQLLQLSISHQRSSPAIEDAFCSGPSGA